MDYLQWHKTQWRVRRVVPPALVAKIGKATLLRSTGTAEYDRAMKIARPIVREFARIIASAARSAGKPFSLGRLAGKRLRGGRVHLRHSDASRRSDGWLTPRRVFDAMPGIVFDVDVASAGEGVGWVPARELITENSLEREWRGMCWMNCPFGERHGMRHWLHKFVRHRDGIALLPASTYTAWFRDFASCCNAVLYVRGYLNFHPADGHELTSRPSFGSCLFAIGAKAVAALRLAETNGLGYIMSPNNPSTSFIMPQSDFKRV